MLRAPAEPVYDSMASDGAGNLTHDGSHDYGWNPFNELERVTSAGGTSTFVRDATGRVSGIRSTRSHSPERRLLWEGTDVVLELDAANQPLRLLESGGFRDFVRQADYFYVRDARGSVIGLMDNTGTLLKRWSYDAWGVRRVVWAHPDHKSLESPIGFCGYYHHPETGLYLTPTRAYSPALRRWLSRDPIGYAGGDTNLFAYVGGDPVNYSDRSGLWHPGIVVPVAMGPLVIAPVVAFLYYREQLNAIRSAEAVHQRVISDWITKRRFGDHLASDLPEDQLADNFYHCVALCRARAAGLSFGVVADFGGLLHELGTEDAYVDLNANSCGYDAGSIIAQSGREGSSATSSCVSACAATSSLYGSHLASVLKYERALGRFPR